MLGRLFEPRCRLRKRSASSVRISRVGNASASKGVALVHVQAVGVAQLTHFRQDMGSKLLYTEVQIATTSTGIAQSKCSESITQAVTRRRKYRRPSQR